MSTVIPFPAKAAPFLADPEEGQVIAIRAMLRYLHREACECGLSSTAGVLTEALAALDAEQQSA